MEGVRSAEALVPEATRAAPLEHLSRRRESRKSAECVRTEHSGRP